MRSKRAIGGLADLDDDLLDHLPVCRDEVPKIRLAMPDLRPSGPAGGVRIGIVRQLQQSRRFLGEGLADAQVWIFRTAPIGGRTLTPGLGFCVELVEIGEALRRKEVVADIADGALDPALLVAAGDGHRSWLVTIMPGEVEQGGVEADGVAAAFEHRALQIVVQSDPGHALPCAERCHVARRNGAVACPDQPLVGITSLPPADQGNQHDRPSRLRQIYALLNSHRQQAA